MEHNAHNGIGFFVNFMSSREERTFEWKKNIKCDNMVEFGLFRFWEA